MAGDATARRRRIGPLARVAAGLGVILAGGLLTLHSAGPWLRGEAVKRLAEAGFPEARLGRIDVDWSGLSLRDLRLADGLAADRLRVTVDPRGLMGRRIAAVRVDGLSVGLTWDGATLGISGGPIVHPSPGDGAPSALPAWTVDRLDLEDVWLTLAAPRGRIEAEGSASVAAADPGRHAADLRLDGTATPGDAASFPFALTGRVVASAAGDVSAADLHAAVLRPPLPGLPLDWLSAHARLRDGRLDATATAETGHGSLVLSGAADWPPAPGAPVASGGLVLDVSGWDLPGRANGVTASGRLAWRLDGDTLALDLATPLDIAIGDPSGSPMLAPWIGGPLAATLHPGEEPLAVTDLTTRRVRAAAHATVPSVVATVGGRVLTADMPDLRLTAAASADDGLESLDLKLRDARVADPVKRIRLDGLDIDARLAGAVAAEVRRGTLRSAASPALFAPLAMTGAGRLDGGRLRGHATIAGADGRFALRLKARNGPDGGRADLALDPLVLAPEGLQPADLSPRFGSSLREVSGRLELDGWVAWRPGGDLSSDLVLRLGDLDLTHDAARIEGLRGSVAVIRPWPPATRPDQTLTANRIDIAGQALRDASIRFEMRPDGELVVPRAVVGLAGGHVMARDVVADPRAATARGGLTLADLDMRPLVDLLGVPGLAAVGRIGGTLPFAVGPEGLRVDAGHLAAEGPGVIRYRPAAPPAALRGGGRATSLMMEALEEFHYRTLSLPLDGRADGYWSATLSLEGANPNLMNGHPFVFNINLSGALEAILRRGLATYRLPEALGQRILGQPETPKP